MTDSKLIRAKYGVRDKIIPEQVGCKWVIDHQVIDEVMYCRRDVDIDLIKEVRTFVMKWVLFSGCSLRFHPLIPRNFS